MSSFGEEIRRERELREISLREVSQATKINIRYLEALEGNNFEHLPGGVFNRGFVKAYSEFVGIDPDAMVNAYLLEEQAQGHHGKAKDRTLLRRQPGPVGTAASQVEPKPGRSIHWVVWALVGAAAVAGVVWWWIARGPESPSAGSSLGAFSPVANSTLERDGRSGSGIDG